MKGSVSVERRRVAAINDISGMGRCSLTVTLPVISAMGHQVCPLPTAVLSAHTGYKSYEFIDLTDSMPALLQSWDKLGFIPDAVYTGFLGSEKQIEPVLSYLKKHKNSLIIVDPVMGDDGVIYKTYTKDMCERMRALCAEADVITPNLTEACILTGLAYPENPTEKDINEIAAALKKVARGNFVITGVKINGALFSFGYDGEFFKVSHEYIELPVCGAGDLFASLLCGYLLSGEGFKAAVKKSGDFLTDALKYTRECKADPKDGIVFEPLLKTL